MYNGSSGAMNSIIEGTTATYNCDNGHFLNGTEKLTCNDGGMWSDQPPTCIRKQLL